ncbi:MAC/perforin domain-containing protein, partial [Sphingobacterium sp. SGL-16]|uniref:MAC/perforin domain-containing protein n=1 Tax=Sphingobacterium sp. SGL-16 TaxID=2710883 RepID=UPI0013EBFA70
QSESTLNKRQEVAKSDLSIVSAAIGLELGGEGTTTKYSSKDVFNRNIKYYTTGGDPSKEVKGTYDFNKTNTSINTANWQNSINDDNATLISFDENGLIPLHELVDDQYKKEVLKTAIYDYLKRKEVRVKHTTTPIYSLWWNGGRDHILTNNPLKEINSPTNEGILFYAYNYQAPGTLPVHRYYRNNGNKSNHLYTISPQTEVLSNYVYEGIEFYAYPNQNVQELVKPIYRYYNSSINDHYWHYNIINPSGYIREGITFYVPK